MEAGPDPNEPASLLARWRAATPRTALPERPAHAAPPPPPPIDPVALLRELEEGIAAALTPEQSRALAAIMEPLRRAVGAPEAERDPAAITLAFDQVEDLLEAFLLARP